MRILILGLPGSGKTTFARKLATQLGLPHFEADAVFWDEKGRERAEFRKSAGVWLSERPQWVAEGHYGKLRDLLDSRITHLVLLDYAYRTILIQWFARSLRTCDFGDLPWLTLKRASLIRGYHLAIERARARGVLTSRLRSHQEAELLVRDVCRAGKIANRASRPRPSGADCENGT